MILTALVMAALTILGQPTTTAPTPNTVQFGASGWYTKPTCLVPGLCFPAQKYPAGTLHIASSFGTEAARTYLSIPAGTVPDGATVSAATLKLPFDTTTVGGGSKSPRTAQIEVCTASGDITAGVLTAAPVANCAVKVYGKVASATANEIDVDLAPLAKQLAVPGTSLVLLPKPGVPFANWEITLADSTIATATTPAASLALTLDGVTAPSTSAAAPSDTALPPVPTDGGAVLPIGPLGNQPIPVITGGSSTPVPSSSAPDSAAQSQAPQPEAASRILPHGFDYPAIFVLALVMGAGILALGRQLTRPLTVSTSTARHGRR